MTTGEWCPTSYFCFISGQLQEQACHHTTCQDLSSEIAFVLATEYHWPVERMVNCQKLIRKFMSSRPRVAVEGVRQGRSVSRKDTRMEEITTLLLRWIREYPETILAVDSTELIGKHGLYKTHLDLIQREKCPTCGSGLKSVKQHGCIAVANDWHEKA